MRGWTWVIVSACIGLAGCGDDDDNPDADVVDYVEPPDDAVDDAGDDAGEAETTPMGPVFLYHNTCWTNEPDQNGMDVSGPFTNMTFRNNIVRGTRYAFECTIGVS